MTEPKKPADHKDPVEAYTWTAPDGRDVVLKPFAKLPVRVFRKARGEGDELAMTFALLEAATDEDGLAVLDDLEIGQLDTVFEGWAAASGVDAPES
jgi:hypothetical protein